MKSIQMPEKVADAIHNVFAAVPNQLSIVGDGASESIKIKVADHPEADCEYAVDITLDWDLPDPGQLLCYISVGIWNPPVPEDAAVTTPFITADEDTYHSLIFRFLSIPSVVAEVAEETAREVMSQIIESLIPLDVRFNEKHFNDSKNPNEMNPYAFSGTVVYKGEYLSWEKWIENNKSPL